MRFFILLFFFSLTLIGFAQSGADRITFSKFNKPKDLALVDTIQNHLVAGTYSQFISEEKEVYNKQSKINRFAVSNSLLNKISNNGSDDISQCFYPQHSINFYKKGKLVKYVLICFECYGIRFSDERWITKTKSEKKRIDLVNELRKSFAIEGFLMQ